MRIRIPVEKLSRTASQGINPHRVILWLLMCDDRGAVPTFYRWRKRRDTHLGNGAIKTGMGHSIQLGLVELVSVL